MIAPQTGIGFAGGGGAWLGTLRRYMIFIAVANLAWEFAHMPLYTLWRTGTLSEIAFAALHCTGGDVLIALSAIMLALFLAGGPAWPAARSGQVAGLTLVFGLAYTLFSEWLNKRYVSVDQEELRKHVLARLHTFNEEELDVKLVVFDEVLEHILRIDRVLRRRA